MKRILLVLLCSVVSGSVASAQTAPRAAPLLESVLRPGMTVWVTDAGGREEKVRIVSASGDVVTASARDEIRRFDAREITRVRTRQSDALWNGALIGAGAAVASGLFLCTRTEPWANCRDDVGPMVGIGALGAGIGIGLDALFRGRQTIYEGAPGSARLQLTPSIGRRDGGLRVSLRF